MQPSCSNLMRDKCFHSASRHHHPQLYLYNVIIIFLHKFNSEYIERNSSRWLFSLGNSRLTYYPRFLLTELILSLNEEWERTEDSENRSCFRDAVHEDTSHSHTFPLCLSKAYIISSVVGRIDYHLCYLVKDDPQP